MENNEHQPKPAQEPQTFGPAPSDPNVPYQQQPVNQQYFAQPQAAPVQYVVVAQSLKGVKGWLFFFTFCFAISGIAYIGYFFNSMMTLYNTSSVLMLIFSPLMAAAYITTTVFIALQKKLGKWLAVGALGLGAVYGVINVVVNFAAGDSTTSSVPVLLSGIVTGLVVEGLLILYFFVSKRVKETLVN